MRKQHVVRKARPLVPLAAAVLVLGVAVACERSPSAGGSSSPGAAAKAVVDSRESEYGGPTAGLATSIDGRRAVAVGAPAPSPARDDEAPADRALATSGAFPPGDPAGAMLIRHGQANVEVRHVDDVVNKVRQTAAQLGGFVANTSLRSGKDEQRAATLEVRVPTAQFDALLAALNSFGKVETVSATVQDVGEEYVDLGAREANLRRVEARLVEMLASRTGKLSDVLTVEQELRRVREEIERYDARLKYLERRTAYSSLDVSLHEPLPLLERQPGPGPIVIALGEAWDRAVGFVAWLIASLGLLIPLGLLLGAGVVVARRLRLFRPGTPPGVSGA